MTYKTRVTLFVIEYGRIVALLLGIVGIVALGAAGWMMMNPPTSTVTHEVDHQDFEVSTSTSAVVVGNDSMWEEGTQLRDQTTYLRHATPTLTIEPTVTVPDDREVTVSIQLLWETRTERAGEVYWSEDETLIETSDTVTDGSISATTELSIPERSERIDEVANQSAGVGSVRTRLHLSVDYETDQYAGTLSKSAEFHITERSYWIEEPLEASETRSTTVEEEIVESPNMRLVYGSSLLGIGSLVAGLIAVSIYRRPIDEVALREKLYRHRYGNWISTGTLPSLFEYENVHMDSLKELVDVAIDNNRRVIHDRRRGMYAVITEDVAYFYSREGTWKPFVSIFDQTDISEHEEFDYHEVTEALGDVGEVTAADEATEDASEDRASEDRRK